MPGPSLALLAHDVHPDARHEARGADLAAGPVPQRVQPQRTQQRATGGRPRITQESAWHLAHRIRRALADGSLPDIEGAVEVDEAYIGGEARNMHAARRRTSPDMNGRRLPWQKLVSTTRKW